MNFSFPKNISLKITTGVKRFAVTSDYDSELVRYFNTFDKRFYDFQTQRWSFPIEKLGNFKEFLDSNQVTYSETDTINMANLVVKKDIIELSFQSYIKQFHEILSIDGIKYLRNEKKFLIPLEKEEELCKKLMEHNFSIFRKEEEKETCSEESAKINAQTLNNQEIHENCNTHEIDQNSSANASNKAHIFVESLEKCNTHELNKSLTDEEASSSKSLDDQENKILKRKKKNITNENEITSTKNSLAKQQKNVKKKLKL